MRRRLAHRLSYIVTIALPDADGGQNTDTFRGEVSTAETATVDGAVKHEVRFILLTASVQNAKHTNRIARSPLKNIWMRNSRKLKTTWFPTLQLTAWTPLFVARS